MEISPIKVNKNLYKPSKKEWNKTEYQKPVENTFWTGIIRIMKTEKNQENARKQKVQLRIM